jgi:hypothetical protein
VKRCGVGNYGLLDQGGRAAAGCSRTSRRSAATRQRDDFAGQSACHVGVSAHRVAADTGLFHRAVVQSGPGALASFGVATARGLASPRTPPRTRRRVCQIARRPLRSRHSRHPGTPALEPGRVRRPFASAR